MNLNQIRAELPQYDYLDDYSFARKIHDDYYPSMDFNEFAEKVDFKMPKRTAGDVVTDLGLSLGKGVVGLGESAVGLADIPTFGAVGKGLEYIGYNPEETRKTIEKGYSDPQKEAFRQTREATGFTGKAKALYENPSAAIQSTVESLPLMLGGAGIARKTLTKFPGLVARFGKTAPALAAALGEGAVSAGSTAEQIRQENESGFLTPKQAGLSVISGLGTGAIAFGGNKIAQTLGFADFDTMAAGLKLDKKAKNIFLRTIGGMIQEGIFEEMPQSGWEQVISNVATNKPVWEGVPEAMVEGGAAGVLMGGGANIIPQRRASSGIEGLGRPEEESPPPADIPPSQPPFISRSGGELIEDIPVYGPERQPFVQSSEVPAEDQAVRRTPIDRLRGLVRGKRGGITFETAAEKEQRRSLEAQNQALINTVGTRSGLPLEEKASTPEIPEKQDNWLKSKTTWPLNDRVINDLEDKAKTAGVLTDDNYDDYRKLSETIARIDNKSAVDGESVAEAIQMNQGLSWENTSLQDIERAEKIYIDSGVNPPSDFQESKSKTLTQSKLTPEEIKPKETKNDQKTERWLSRSKREGEELGRSLSEPGKGGGEIETGRIFQTQTGAGEGVRPKVKRPKPGMVRLDKGGKEPFTEYREIKEGKNKGKIEVKLADGSKKTVRPIQIREYPEIVKYESLQEVPVRVQAVDAETGDTFEIDDDAQSAINEIKAKRDIIEELRNCLS
jgi:hypothetical protein